MKECSEEQERQKVLICSQSEPRLYLRYLAALIFAFLSITGSAIILAFSFVLLQDCAGCRSPNEDVDSTNLEAVLGLIAVPLCIIGGLTDFGNMSTRNRHRVAHKRVR